MGKVIRANRNFIFQSVFVESFFTLCLYIKKDCQDAQNSSNFDGTCDELNYQAISGSRVAGIANAVSTLTFIP